MKLLLVDNTVFEGLVQATFVAYPVAVPLKVMEPPAQTAVSGPAFTPADLFTLAINDLVGLAPQGFVALTVKVLFPSTAFIATFTVMELVPCPLTIVQPVGNVHVYPMAFVLVSTVYTRPFAGGHIPDEILTLPADGENVGCAGGV